MQFSKLDQLTNPITTQIENLVKDIPGWTPLDQLIMLFTIAMATGRDEGDIVEVGSWCGRSAVVLGLAARLSGKSFVRCIDPFPEKSDWKQNSDGSYSFEVVIDGKKYGGYKETTVWREAFETQMAGLYEKHLRVMDCFLETVASRGLGDVIRLHRGDLGSFLDTVDADFKCRMIFLDGDHGFDAVCSDIRKIERWLVPGGWLCFDDAFTTYESVDRAIRELIIGNPDYDCCQQMTRKLFVARRKRHAA